MILARGRLACNVAWGVFYGATVALSVYAQAFA